jgi:hypothetical protein
MSKTIAYESLQSIPSIVNALVQMCQINSETTNIPLRKTERKGEYLFFISLSLQEATIIFTFI